MLLIYMKKMEFLNLGERYRNELLSLLNWTLWNTEVSIGKYRLFIFSSF